MTKEQSIDLQIRKEYDDFNNSIYSGEPALPKDLLERFKVCVFKLPPASHRLSTGIIKQITSKKLKDLNNVDVPTILNTITLLPFSELYPNLDAALKGNKEIEELKITFNLMVKEINERLEGKRNNMLKLVSNAKQPLKLVN